MLLLLWKTNLHDNMRWRLHVQANQALDLKAGELVASVGNTGENLAVIFIRVFHSGPKHCKFKIAFLYVWKQ